MGHRPHELAVLDDGAAAHALDDAPCLLDQGGIRDRQGEAFGARSGAVDGGDLHAVLPHLAVVQGAEDGGIPLPQLLLAAYGQAGGGGGWDLGKDPVDPAFGVPQEGSRLAGGEVALDGPGVSRPATEKTPEAKASGVSCGMNS